MVDNSIQIVTWNARSLRPKVIELGQFLTDKNIQVALITETHLSPNIKLSIPNYSIIRYDRDEAKGGGVAIVISKHVKYRILPHFNTKLIEAIGVEIESNIGNIRLISAYFGRQAKSTDNSRQLFKQDLRKLAHTNCKFIIGTDLNARHPSWGNIGSNVNGRILFDDLQLGLYSIHQPFSPTFVSPKGSSSILDFFLTNLPSGISEPQTIQELDSDHFPVAMRVGITSILRPVASRKNFHRVNWNRLRTTIDNQVDPDRNINTKEQIDDALEDFVRVVQTTVESNVRTIPVRSEVLEIDNFTKLLIGKRNTFIRQFRRTGDRRIKALVNRLRKIIAKRLVNIKNQKFQQKLAKLENNSKPFWKIAKILKTKPQNVPHLKINDQTLVTPLEKANAIAKNIVKSHEIGLTMTSPMENTVKQTIETLNNTNSYLPEEHNVSTEEIRTILKGMRNMKAPGEDGILNIVLKNLGDNSLTLLCNIFNKCLNLSYFPNSWKRSKVIPILKPGKDPTSEKSYRPISLLSSISKIFEKLILSRLDEHIQRNNILMDEQFGFRKGHSTTHQLARVVNKIKRNKEVKYSTAMTLLDVEKAFDNVWHQGLIHKLVRYNFPTYLVKILQDYLTNRNFRVFLQGVYSIQCNIKAGVPQGSILGPVLYSVFTSDIPPLQEGELSLFADDSAIQVRGRITNAITKKMQRCLDSFLEYTNTWKIKINAIKTQIILFPLSQSPKHKPNSKIVIEGNAIEWSPHVKYLGLTTDEKLLFSTHVNNTRTKCLILLNRLYPLINKTSKLSLTNKLAVYKQIVLPVLDYAAPIWDMCAKSHKNKLQIIQNRFLKLILGLDRNARTTVVHDMAKVELLETRFQKIKNNFINKARLSEYETIRNIYN